MEPHLPSNVLAALTDAIIKVFWRRDDMRAVLVQCGVPNDLLTRQDWNQYKIKILQPILTKLNTAAGGYDVLRKLLQQTLSFTDCNHLLRWEDGRKRKADGEAALDHLRNLARQFAEEQKAKTSEENERRRAVEAHVLEKGFEVQLQQIHQRFMEFWMSTDPQARGYLLEKLLYDMFVLFDLQPRSPFKVVGEQIDGAFVHDGDNFLLEAKWQSDPVQLHDIRDLDGAVRAGLDNTLGLFVSINGFSADAITRYLQGGRPRIVCMTGEDLVTVTDGQFDLNQLLSRKRAIASQSGKVLVSAKDILQGKQ